MEFKDQFKKIPRSSRSLITKPDYSPHFDKAVFQRGQRLANLTHITELSVDVFDQCVYISGKVKSANSRKYYNTGIYFYFEHEEVHLSTHCSCPYSDNCKHNAAITCYTVSSLKTLNSNESGEFNDDINDWLDNIDDEVSSSAADNPARKQKNNHHIIYGLCPKTTFSEPELKLFKGRVLKTRGHLIDTTSSIDPDPYRPPGYLSDEDLYPLTYYAKRKSDYQGLALTNSYAPKMLTAAIHTGRLYLLPSESYQKDEVGIKVTMGEPITVEATWETHEDASIRPTIKNIAGSNHIILPTNPVYILDIKDEITAEMRPVDCSNLPNELLSNWTKGPAIPANNIPDLVTRLSKNKISTPIPEPIKVTKIKKSKPVPHLHFKRANPFNHTGIQLSGQPLPVNAILSFDYKGHKLEPDLENKPEGDLTFTAKKNNKIYEITRHTKAEVDFVMMLSRDYEIKLAGIHDYRVIPEFNHHFLPAHNHTPLWDEFWASFLQSSVPELEKLGFTTSVDSSAELNVINFEPENLQTGIDDLPDHGIDWFQFQASYLTPEGNNVSLLPLVSLFIQQLTLEDLDHMIASSLPDQKMILRHPDTNDIISFPRIQLLTLTKNICELFGHNDPEQPLHRIQAADIASSLDMDGTGTLKDLAALGNKLKDITELPKPVLPKEVKAQLRDYQLDGYHWMQFLARHSLHGILADDMGLGKTLQTLTHIQAEVSTKANNKLPSLVIAPTSVISNWVSEAAKFTPKLKVLLLHGPDRKQHYSKIKKHHIVITSYSLLVRDFDILEKEKFHILALDEAQYIKNPKAKVSEYVCKIQASHRISLSGTPLENHLGELWAQMRFLMPGLLGSFKQFTQNFRTPIEKHQDGNAQLTLNRRVAPLILRRTKDVVAKELPAKTEIVHSIPLNKEQIDLYETVRAAMDSRIKDAISDKGLAKSHIIVLDALLKLRQICCHPAVLKLPAAKKIKHSAKFDFLTQNLLPTMLEEGRKILIFSSFTTMLTLIEKHLIKEKIKFSKITGQTRKRAEQIEAFQNGNSKVFLISLKAGGTGLNLTAADTVIHYDPWWNPAAENQATDRAYRIGQDKPVFVHKLICEGSIEQRIQDLQSQKSTLVEALLTAETNRLKIDENTLSYLTSPIE